ncbi:hypothetical protein HaLaN_02382, partial [Haematococcus lacustris]
TSRCCCCGLVTSYCGPVTAVVEPRCGGCHVKMMPAVAASFHCSQPGQEHLNCSPHAPAATRPLVLAWQWTPWSPGHAGVRQWRGSPAARHTPGPALVSIQALDQLAQAGARNHSMRLVVEANTTRQRCKVAEPVSTARHQTWPCL